MLKLTLKCVGQNDSFTINGVSHCLHGVCNENSNSPLHLQLDCLAVVNGDKSPCQLATVACGEFPKVDGQIESLSLSDGKHTTHYFWPTLGWKINTEIASPFFTRTGQKGIWISFKFVHSGAEGAAQTIPFAVNEKPAPSADGLNGGNVLGVLHPRQARAPDNADRLHGLAIGNPATEFIDDLEIGEFVRPDHCKRFVQYSKRHTQSNSTLLDLFAWAKNMTPGTDQQQNLTQTLSFSEPKVSENATLRSLEADRENLDFKFTTGDPGNNPTLRRIVFCEYDGIFQGNIRLPSARELARLTGGALADHPLFTDPGYFFRQLENYDFSMDGRAANYSPIETITILAN